MSFDKPLSLEKLVESLSLEVEPNYWFVLNPAFWAPANQENQIPGLGTPQMGESSQNDRELLNLLFIGMTMVT